jgi:4-hydroxybenzoate polyprenyltransferase
MSLTESEPSTARVSPARRVVGLIAAARPRQWVKNLACFAGLIFSGHLFDAEAIGAAFWAFLGFCLASSSVYLVNDVYDRQSDAANPKKRSRPIAAGLVPVSWAITAAFAFALAALASSLALSPGCRAVLAAYLLMSYAYSIRLKHTVLVDVLIIALGFVLRIIYGVFAVGVAPTPWILLCMFFLALFLGFAKRRSELIQFDGTGSMRRPVLEKYRTVLLDLLLAMTGTMAILSYALYTLIGRPGNETLVITVPLVVYGVCRYLLLVVVFDVGDSPDENLLSDRMLILSVVLWVILCVAILYFRLNFIHFQTFTPSAVPGR